MAIINNPKQEVDKPEETKGIIPSQTKAKGGVNLSAGTGNGVQTISAPSNIFKYILSVVILISISLGLYFIVPKLIESKAAPIEAIDITLEIDRMVRIGGLINLVKKKVEQNQITLQQSKKLRDDILVDTMRLALAQNLADLDKYQDDLIMILVNVHKMYSENKDQVVKQFREKLKSTDDLYKVGAVKVINVAIKLMAAIPPESKPAEFFKKQIKIQK